MGKRTKECSLAAEEQSSDYEGMLFATKESAVACTCSFHPIELGTVKSKLGSKGKLQCAAVFGMNIRNLILEGR